MEKYKVSIFTCVYNRVHTIDRVFISVKNQTYKNIEHVIVDDGSTDNIKECVERYMNEVEYPVKFIQKENGGKHTATNVAWDNCEGDFIIQLDSDDELLPDAILFLIQNYEKIPDGIKNEYWCVQGRCRNQICDKMIGTYYPDNINFLPADEARMIARNITGEKIGLMKREKLMGHRYPVPKCVTFVSENYLWYPLNMNYRTWYTNQIVRIYYQNEQDSLSKTKRTSQVSSNASFMFKYYLENRREFRLSISKIWKYLVRYSIHYELATDEYKKEYSKLLNSRDVFANMVLILLQIPSSIYSAFLKSTQNKSN